MTEVLGKRCLDGGACHHSCAERCFRRECCEPLSTYTGPWKYDTHPTDAIGNPIVLGKKYGYSISDSGISYTVTGVAENITSTARVTLHVESRVKRLYGQNPEPAESAKRTATVYGCVLFPI